MSRLPTIVCIIEAKDKDCMVKEGFDLVLKIQEIEPQAVLELTYKNNDIIMTTSKAMYRKSPTLTVTVETILQQHGYTNKKGQ